MSNLINAYLKYKTQRAKIKARQREELEHELAWLAVDVGREIDVEKTNGTKIEEISFMIGLKNRTFIYKMWNAFLDSQKEPEQTIDEPVDEQLEPYEYYFAKDGKSVRVTFDEDELVYLDLDDEGNVVDVPESWTQGTKEERKRYAIIIKEIESHVGVTTN